MAHRRTPLVLDPPGRFTPAQIIAFVLAVAVAFVLIPVGARAAGSLVTLVDSTSSRQARVDKDNSLTVSERPATSTPWFNEVDGAPGFAPMFTPPAGKTKLALSTLTVANFNSAAGSSELWLYGNLDCSSNFLDNLEFVIVPAADTVTISFPQPLLIGPGGSNWCLTALIPSNTRVTATGYYY